jgi:hypothetical protein
MTTAELIHDKHGVNPLQSFMVMSLAGGVVLAAGWAVTGGYDNIRHRVQAAHDTSLGLKDIDLNRNAGGATIGIGVAASSCVKNDAFSVDRVYEVRDGASEAFKITVQKIGAGTLDAAGVEACIIKATHENVSLAISSRPER